MTVVDDGPPVIVAPDDCRCLNCGHNQPPGTPVALIASHDGRDYVACTGCARDVEDDT